MKEFPIAKTEDAYHFCCEIQATLMELTGCSEEAAVGLILKIWKDVVDIEADPLLYEELPYYYACCIINRFVTRDPQPNWWKDPNLWPPPAKYQKPI